MMKFVCILAVFIFSHTGAWAGKTSSVKKPFHPDSIKFFYARYGLNADSAQTPFLYQKIYEWIGTRYCYAGESKKGIDCSGFTAAMYKQVYCIQLSGGSADFWRLVNPIKKEALKEGDLVFFKIRRKRISHVGIYLGNNKFAHASVKNGVIISDLNEAYYKKYYFSGGRVIN